jgi:hypothetical protein
MLVTVQVICIRLLMTVPVNLDQVVDYSSHYVGSKCWLLFTLYWIMLLVTVPFLDQNVG